jgi:hypothetical protein
VVHFSSGDNDVKDKPRSRRPCTAVTPQNEERLDQLICANWRIMTRELCTKLNISFSVLETMVRAVKQRVTTVGADFYEHSMQALVHHW